MDNRERFRAEMRRALAAGEGTEHQRFQWRMQLGLLGPEELNEYVRNRKHTRNLTRYKRRYARNTPKPPGRGRREVVHTLAPYFRAFDIVSLAEACWGWHPKHHTVPRDSKYINAQQGD